MASPVTKFPGYGHECDAMGQYLWVVLSVTNNFALDEPVWIGLRGINLGIYSGILDALMPAQVCGTTVISTTA